MQKYWTMFEYSDKNEPARGVMRGYACCKNGKDAIVRARFNVAKRKLLRVWICHLASDDPKLTLVFGDVPTSGPTQPLDNPSIGMLQAFRGETRRTATKKENKPRVRYKAPPDTPTYVPYEVVSSELYLKNMETVNE